MSVTFRAFGNGSPSTELDLVPAAQIDPALFIVKSLTSTQLNVSVNFSGQVYDFTYLGLFDLSVVSGPLPKNLAEAKNYTIPNAIASLSISTGGKTMFSETYSPAITFDRVANLLDNGQQMVAELAGNDVYYSSTDATGNNNDTVYLYAGNDTYYVNHPLLSKVDLFYGGTGIDTAVYAQKSSNFTIAPTNAVWNYVTQKSELPGFAITDKTQAINTLYANQVERLKFADTNVALDVGPYQNAGSVYMLYKAAFNRAPDTGGMGYWLAQKDAGLNIVTNIAQSFLSTPEFIAKYGTNPSNATYIDKLYQNVLGRSGDAGGVAYWNQQLDSGAVSKAAALVSFATLPEGASNVASLIANGIPYTEWVG